jgi:hypothetical protein
MIALELWLVNLAAIDLNKHSKRWPNDVGPPTGHKRNHEICPVRDSAVRTHRDLPPWSQSETAEELHRPGLGVAFGWRFGPARVQHGTQHVVPRHGAAGRGPDGNAESEGVFDREFHTVLRRDIGDVEQVGRNRIQVSQNQLKLADRRVAEESWFHPIASSDDPVTGPSCVRGAPEVGPGDFSEAVEFVERGGAR